MDCLSAKWTSNWQGLSCQQQIIYIDSLWMFSTARWLVINTFWCIFSLFTKILQTDLLSLFYIILYIAFFILEFIHFKVCLFDWIIAIKTKLYRDIIKMLFWVLQLKIIGIGNPSCKLQIIFFSHVFSLDWLLTDRPLVSMVYGRVSMYSICKCHSLLVWLNLL